MLAVKLLMMIRHCFVLLSDELSERERVRTFNSADGRNQERDVRAERPTNYQCVGLVRASYLFPSSSARRSAFRCILSVRLWRDAPPTSRVAVTSA